MKKFLSMTVLLLIIVLAGCQKDQTTKPKQKTNTNDAKVVKIEKLETMSYEDFYENLKEEELNDLDIIQVADQKITAVIGNYFLVLNENKKNHTYKINKIIDLHPYGMNYYYNEESTMFYPSKDGEKYLIYNECRYNSKDQTINAKDDKELKSIVIDLKKDEKQITGITNEIEETVYVLKINTVRSLRKDLSDLTHEDIEKYCIGKSYVQSKIDL